MPQIRIGLAGNPNAGKTTIFNALTGAHQKVANYAGVTVEKKEGRHLRGEYECIIFDLPGTYSLTSYSIDEVITRDFVLNEKPDVIIDVLDATNLERNLYLALQFQELKLPIVGALNIIDQAEARGISIDEVQLSKLLGFPIIKTVGSKGRGLEAVLDAAIDVFNKKTQSTQINSYGASIEAGVQALSVELERDTAFSQRHPSRWLAAKLLEKDEDAAKRLSEHAQGKQVAALAATIIAKIEKDYGRDSEIVLSEQRYAFLHGATKETIHRSVVKRSVTEQIDRVLLNRFLGLPIFFGILWAIFQMTFFLGAYPQGWLETFFTWTSEGLRTIIPEGMLQSLLVDGVVGGVGAVLSFIPLVVILFTFISILEDTGYMARVAFIMDRFLHIFGLHGQSFLPMMLGFGCSVPAIMATRTLKGEKDRIATILIIPFMSCGAKLPVYVLLAGTFFAANAGTMVLLVFVIGVFLALLSALLFRKTILRGESTPFVMELPPYRSPTGTGILWHVFEKAIMYFKKAGTMILAASILIWAITTFPKAPEADKPVAESSKTMQIAVASAAPTSPASAAATTATDNAPGTDAENQLTYSIAGRVGTFIEPLVAPLGFDWKIGIATITGFAAKEVVISTLGVLYRVGDDSGEDNAPLKTALQNDRHFNPLVAFVLMLFTLIIAPCLAAQSTIKAELGWKWYGFYVAYSIAASWAICFLVYQIGRLLGLGV